MIHLLEMSAWGSLMILAIALLRQAAKRSLPKAALPMLWGVVLARLLIPLRWTLQWTRLAATTATPPLWTAAESAIQAVQSAGQRLEGIGAPSGQAVSVWVWIWLLGMGIIAATLVAYRLYWRRRLSTAVAVRDTDAIATWRGTHARLRRVRIMQTTCIQTPMTSGVLRPTIYLPTGMPAAMLPHVLAHEGTHIWRHDVARKHLMLLALCLHWFNPLVWLMLALLSRDIEMACDSQVLRTLEGDQRIPYARTLASLAMFQSQTPQFLASFTGNPVEERIRTVLRPPQKRAVGIALTCVLCALCLLGFAGAEVTQNAHPGTVGLCTDLETGEQTFLAPGKEVDEVTLMTMLAGRGIEHAMWPEALPEGMTLTSIHILAPEKAFDMAALGEPETTAEADGMRYDYWTVPDDAFDAFDRYLVTYSDGESELTLEVGVVTARDGMTRMRARGVRDEMFPNELVYATGKVTRGEGEADAVYAIQGYDTTKADDPTRSKEIVLTYTLHSTQLDMDGLLGIMESMV